MSYTNVFFWHSEHHKLRAIQFLWIKEKAYVPMSPWINSTYSLNVLCSLLYSGERGQVPADQRGDQQQSAVVGRGADHHPAVGRLLADETT